MLILTTRTFIIDTSTSVSCARVRVSRERRCVVTNFSGFKADSYTRGLERPKAKCFSSAVAVILILAGLLVVACSQHASQSNSQQQRSGSDDSQTDTDKGNANSIPSMASPPGNLPLRTLTDVALTGGTTRLDYQSLDSDGGRLYIAHLGSDLMTVFDVNKQTVVGDVKELKRVHGVLAVPELHRVYASATGTNELAVIDDQTLQIVARVSAGDYPDGIAYASKEGKIYVSDLHGKTDTVIDAKTNQRLTTIQLGGGAGNTQYDPVSDRIFVTVDGRNELAEIDPHSDQIAGRYQLTGCREATAC